MFRKFLPVAILFVGFQVNAAIINMTDGILNYNYDNTTGLDWLDLTHTDGLSYNMVNSLFTGWDIANESVWRTMYGNYDNTDADGSVYGYAQTGVDNIGESARGYDLEMPTTFLDDFGFTYSSTIVVSGKGNTDPDVLTATALGFMLNDVDNGPSTDDDLRIGGMGGQIYQDDYAFVQDYIYNEFDRSSNHGYYLYKYADTSTTIGWYLVRQHEQQAVSEPQILTLMGIGILGMGMGIARRHRTKSTK